MELTSQPIVFTYDYCNFAEASKLLGYSSPSTLYKLRKEDQLEDYLIEIQGRLHLVMKPDGKPKSKEYLGTILQ